MVSLIADPADSLPLRDDTRSSESLARLNRRGTWANPRPEIIDDRSHHTLRGRHLLQSPEGHGIDRRVDLVSVELSDC